LSERFFRDPYFLLTVAREKPFFKGIFRPLSAFFQKCLFLSWIVSFSLLHGVKIYGIINTVSKSLYNMGFRG